MASSTGSQPRQEKTYEQIAAEWKTYSEPPTTQAYNIQYPSAISYGQSGTYGMGGGGSTFPSSSVSIPASLDLTKTQEQRTQASLTIPQTSSTISTQQKSAQTIPSYLQFNSYSQQRDTRVQQGVSDFITNIQQYKKPTYQDVRSSLTISSFKGPTGTFESSAYKYSSEQRGIYQQQNINFAQRAKGVGYEIVGFSIGSILFGKSLIKDPAGTLASTGEALTTRETYLAFGEKLANRPELALTDVGLYIGTPKLIDYGIKQYGRLSTIGREELPVKSLVAPEVLSGSKRFPFEKPSKQPELINKKDYRLPGSEKPMGYHATPSRLGLTVKAGSSEIPGLYISIKGISTYFLKLTKNEATQFSLIPQFKTPKVAAITPERFVKGVSEKPGTAGIPMIKTEPEAVLPVGTKLIKQPSKYFFRWEGNRIPINEFKAVGETTGKKAGKIYSIEKISSEYSLPKSYKTPPYSLPSYKGSRGSLSYGISSKGISRISKGNIIRGISIPKSNYGKGISIGKGFGGYSGISGLSKLGYSPFSTGTSTNRQSKSSKIIPLPTSLIGGSGKGKGLKFDFQLGKQPKKYQPSLYAIGFNIKSMKMPKGYGSGITVRPLQD
jgi:hypothetical protein